MADSRKEAPSGPEGEAQRAEANRRFINRGSGYMLLDNASKALEPLLVLLCAKAYAGGEWGVFKYYESLALLLTRLASLGLDRGVVWVHSRCGDEAAFLRIFSRCAKLVFLVCCGLGAAVFVQHLGLVPDLFGWKGKLPAAGTLQLACFLAAVPVQALTLLFLQSYLNKRALMQGLLVRNLAIPSVIYGPALLLSYTSAKPYGLALPYLLGNLAGLALAAFFFFRLYARRPRWSLAPGASRNLFRFSLPLASTDFFMSFAYRIDLLLLGRYSGIQAVEIYAVINMISNTLRSLRQSFDGIMLSVFSSENRGRVSESQRRNFNYATWMVTSLQIPFFFLAIIFGRELLGLISPVYSEGYHVLAIAVFFGLLITPGAFSGQLLVGLGRTIVIPASQVSFFLSTLALNLLLIPRYGAEGAAAATGTGTFIGGMVAFAGIWRYSGSFMLMPSFLRPLVVEAAILAVPATVHFWLRPGLPVDIAIFGASLGCFCLYVRAQWRGFNART